MILVIRRSWLFAAVMTCVALAASATAFSTAYHQRVRKVVVITPKKEGDLVESDQYTLEPQAAANEILAARAQALRTGDLDAVKVLYNLDYSAARWAYEHEVRRVRYMQAWTQKRGVYLVETATKARVVRMERRTDSVWFYLIQTSSFAYIYNDDPEQHLNQFGVGTRHVMELVLRDNRWVVKRDWYTDPLDEDVLIPEVTPALVGVDAPDWVAPALQSMRRYEGTDAEACVVSTSRVSNSSTRGYDRAAAIVYADTYCGAAAGCGNNNRYNQRYRDYTGLGGDCTNFVSQALGDKTGGALPMNGSWCYGGGGSQAWVQARSFASYLQYSGRATRIARGKFTAITKPLPDEQQGLIGRLRPGDVISYEEKGKVVHNAIITALDSRGVPLVNTHTADRYHVPYDLGWDRQTYYWLFRMHD